MQGPEQLHPFWLVLGQTCCNQSGAFLFLNSTPIRISGLSTILSILLHPQIFCWLNPIFGCSKPKFWLGQNHVRPQVFLEGALVQKNKELPRSAMNEDDSQRMTGFSGLRTVRIVRITRLVPRPSNSSVGWVGDIIPGWWFGTFFIFPYIGNNHPNWRSYFSEGSNHQPDTLPSSSYAKPHAINQPQSSPCL